MSKLLDRLLNRKPAGEAGYRLRVAGISPPLKMRIHERGDAYISRDLKQQGVWEPEETKLVMASLSPGMVFVDVGANIGYFSLVASRRVGDGGRVFAFEPDPANFALLEANCNINQCTNVSAHRLALSNENASGRLYLSDFNMGDHTIYRSEVGRDSVPIDLVKGRDFFSDRLETIDFLKVDTQGSEYQVLDGLLPTIKASLPGLVMMIEFSPNSMATTGVDGGAFLALFDDLDGSFYILAGEGLIPISRYDLGRWTRLTQKDPGSEGFLNLVFSGKPLEQDPSYTILDDLGFFDNALEFLIGAELERWSGQALTAACMSACFQFSGGWSFMEDWGIWSEGPESRLKCILVDDLAAPVLSIKGRYFGEPEQTGVFINGSYLGGFDLSDARLTLDEELLAAGRLDIKLVHLHPQRPCDLGQVDDNRPIKFGLECISLHRGEG